MRDMTVSMCHDSFIHVVPHSHMTLVVAFVVAHCCTCDTCLNLFSFTNSHMTLANAFISASSCMTYVSIREIWLILFPNICETWKILFASISGTWLILFAMKGTGDMTLSICNDTFTYDDNGRLVHMWDMTHSMCYDSFTCDAGRRIRYMTHIRICI